VRGQTTYLSPWTATSKGKIYMDEWVADADAGQSVSSMNDAGFTSLSIYLSIHSLYDSDICSVPYEYTLIATDVCLTRNSSSSDARSVYFSCDGTGERCCSEHFISYLMQDLLPLQVPTVSTTSPRRDSTTIPVIRRLSKRPSKETRRCATTSTRTMMTTMQTTTMQQGHPTQLATLTTA